MFPTAPGNIAVTLILPFAYSRATAFSEAGKVLGERLLKGGCRPASTLLGVASLFHQDIMIEIEATAIA